MKFKAVTFIALFILIFTSGAFAETTIKAQVSKDKITTDEALTYKIIITSTEKQLPLPQVQKPEGFTVISQVQSSNLSLQKGELKTTLIYAFVLLPTQTGKLTIPPASINVGGKTYSSQPIEIEVTQGERRQGRPESNEPQFTL